MEVEVVLVVAAINMNDRFNPRFLVVSAGELPAFPAKTLPDAKTGGEVAAELLSQYTGIDVARWSTLRLYSSVVLDAPDRIPGKRVIAMTYVCMVPDTTPLQNGAQWSSLRDLLASSMHGDHLEALRNAKLRH